LHSARRYADVVESAAELKRNSPELYKFPITLGDSLMMLGRFEEARKVYAEEPADDPIRLAGEAVLAARSGDRRAALATLARIERLYGEAASYQYAEIHASLGQADQAFAALDRGWQIKDPGLLGMKVDPTLDPIRSDLRFTALLRKVGFPA
jgi:tetratricopeptide (TPR) repeat protein